MFTLYWTREDGQGDIDMGTFPTEEAAEAAIPAAKRELLDQCGEDAQRQAIEDGSWSVQSDDPE